MTAQDARERAWEMFRETYPNLTWSEFATAYDEGHADGRREDEQRIAALEAGLDEERVKFQNETLRTSELTQLLLRFERLHEDRGHEPGAWSRGCIDCELVAEARALISKPVNVRALAGSEESAD